MSKTHRNFWGQWPTMPWKNDHAVSDREESEASAMMRAIADLQSLYNGDEH